METDFNPQESEFQETDNQLNPEEGQLDGTGSWDGEETADQDHLEDHEEPDNGNSYDTEEESDLTVDSSEEDIDDDNGNISDDDEDYESDDEKNTLNGNSNRVLSFEDYFRN